MLDTSSQTPAQLVHALTGRIVGIDGGAALRRGVGIGNWLLPEGYMWGFGDPVTSPRAIEAFVARLVGPDRAAIFWSDYVREFFTERDVAAIAAAGFDHIRLPINARGVMTDSGEFIEAGFEVIERCVTWCTNHGLLVVLDLHGAPGGQTGTNIDDSPHGKPELFMDARYRDLTERLWLELSARYRDNDTVAAYDLLNEPLPNEYQHTYGAVLAALYRRLTTAIRATGDQHLIMYEGSHWANNWSIFTEVWDENTALQFHKYWSAPDGESIREYLAIGRRLGLPVYMGESGENSTDWIQTAFQLFEDSGIGWNFWPWKKVETFTSPCSVHAPEGWADIVAAASGTVPAPSAEVAWRILTELIENMKLENCHWNVDVHAATFRVAPLTIPASGHTFERATQPLASPETTGARGFRNGDGPRLRRTRPDSAENPFAPDADERERAGSFEMVMAAGEQVAYDVGVPNAGAFVVLFEGCNLHGLDVRWDDGAQLVLDDRQSTSATNLTQGRHRLLVSAGRSGAVLLRLAIELAD